MNKRKKKKYRTNIVNLGEQVRAFFNYLVSERNVSPNTIHTYRDTIVIFMRYLADFTEQRIEKICIEFNIFDLVLSFLQHIESKRNNAISTRNNRLSVLKSFFRFVAYNQPMLAFDCCRISLIPTKKDETRILDYIETDEMEAIISEPNRNTKIGFRDYTALLLLYNTGCRASELVGISYNDVCLESPSYVKILGKGRRWRTVPLWVRTVEAIKNMISDHKNDNSSLFIGQRGNPLTRAGVRYIVGKYVNLASLHTISLKKHKVTPHTIRHTTAVAILRATKGDIDGTSKILGHACLSSTKIYTDNDKSGLTEALNKTSTAILGSKGADWKPSDDLLDWLESL